LKLLSYIQGKGVTTLSFSLSELIFFSHTLHERYQHELLMIFRDHAGILIPINVELASHCALTDSSVAIEYEALHASLLRTALSVRDDLNPHLLHMLLDCHRAGQAERTAHFATTDRSLRSRLGAVKSMFARLRASSANCAACRL
jgi:hypothetical protein